MRPIERRIFDMLKANDAAELRFLADDIERTVFGPGDAPQRLRLLAAFCDLRCHIALQSIGDWAPMGHLVNACDKLDEDLDALPGWALMESGLVPCDDDDEATDTKEDTP